MLLEELEPLLQRVKPDIVGFTVPFPGNLYGALRLAKHIKQISPETVTIMGGGYPNTELRTIKEPRFFDYIDFLTLDDGEGPWLRLLENWTAAPVPTNINIALPAANAASAEVMSALLTDNGDRGSMVSALSAVGAVSLDTMVAADEPIAAFLKPISADVRLQRTFLRTAVGEIEYVNHPFPDVPHAEVGTPDYSDLPLTEYLSVLVVLNPMHRL